MLTSLRKIVQDVSDAQSFRDAVDVLVRDVCEALRVEVCSVFLVDATQTRLVFVANQGFNPRQLGRASVSVDEGLVGLVCRRAEPINLEAATEHPAFHYIKGIGEEPYHAFLGVPIIHHRRTLGVIVVQQKERRRFDESEEAFLVTLSAQLANVVAHAEATGEVQALVGGKRVLQDRMFRGVPGSSGIGIGRCVVVHPAANLDSVPEKEAEDVRTELLVFDRAIESVRGDIRNIETDFADSLPPEELALFDAYLHMLDDNAIAGDVRQRIRGGQWAQGALKQVIREHVRRFDDMQDAYLRERSADVADLGQRVLAYLQDIRETKQHFPEQTVLVGDEITAAMLTNIPQDRLVGIASVRGSGSSHVSILARALGIPAVMGATDLPILEIDGQTLVVDGFYGEVFVTPSEDLQQQYRELQTQEREFSAELDTLKDLPSVTRDGHRVRLWVNVGLTGDISRSLDRGAEGIGLFRTEVPFMEQDRFPTEEEQRIVYREHMVAFEPRPVTMRTLDVGGDKSLTYFPINEDNPFLGWRGIRVTLDHPEIFMVQVRAMLKANAGLRGILRIMLPMISSIDEVDEAAGLVARAYDEVLEEGFDVKRPWVGVMVEVPAAVYQAREIARRVDFLAVGSNDLTQYMLAVDRNNARVAGLYQEMHPAVLSALREVARAASRSEKPVGICGELAGTPEGAVLLLGMGYHVLSMNATNLPRVKWVIRNVKRRDARRILAHALRLQTADAVQQYVRNEIIEAGLGRIIPQRHA